MKTFSKKGWIITAVVILIVLFGRFVSPIPALSTGGNTALFYMIGLVVLLVTNIVSVGLIAIMSIAFLPVLGLTESLDEAAAMFGSTMFWFALACFAIAAVMTKLPLSKRISLLILKVAPKNINGVISALFIATAILSAFMSNFSAAIILTAIAKQFLEIYDTEEERKQSRSSLFIAIVLGAAIGGVVTPMGSGCMVIAKNFLEQNGYAVSFVSWIAFGLPVAIVMFAASLFVLTHFLHPVKLSSEKINGYIEQLKSELPDKWSVPEIIATVILVVTLVFWVLNFNMILVALICTVLLLFPGFGILTYDSFEKETGWGTVMLIPALMVVVSVLNQQGVLQWLVDGLIKVIPDSASPFLVICMFGVFIAAILIVMPSGPVITTVMVPIAISLGLQIGVHPVALGMAVSFFATFGFIIPTETVALMVSDGGKNFDSKDLPKIGLPVSIVAIIICAIWLPICTGFFF